MQKDPDITVYKYDCSNQKYIQYVKMQLIIFCILVIGAFAHPSYANKQFFYNQSVPNNETTPENIISDDMASLAVTVIHGTSGYRVVWLTAILTRYWLLSPHDYTFFPKNNITVQTVQDILSSNIQDHEIDFIIKIDRGNTDSEDYTEEDDSMLRLFTFSLIKLKNPLIFGDFEKPIPIDWQSKDLQKDLVVKVIRLTSNHLSAGEVANPDKFMTVSSATIMGKKKCEARLNSYRLLYHQIRNDQLFCTKSNKQTCSIKRKSIAILNGNLVGYSFRSCLSTDGEVPFMKMSILYDWIVAHVPGLKKVEE